MQDKFNLPQDLMTLLDIYKYRAEVQPDDIAYIFLEDGDDLERKITFQELHKQALVVAQGLREHAVEGDRAILVYQPGMDFIVAFTACVYAGVIAVPVYPPTGIKDIPRFVKIAKSSGAVVFCTQSDMLMPMKMAVDSTPQVSDIPCLATDTINEPIEGQWNWPNTKADTIMFLQFTSGSTGDPKGVMVSHGNLLHNESVSALSGQHDSSLIGVNWAPQYHDMGLIGSILMVPYSGSKLILMSPIAFLQKPVRWLKAVSKYKATASGGPNFAYELCLRKIKDEDLESLDLSSWRYAYNGAEAIRTSTLDRFCERFGKCGFRRDAFSPIYGLAESTLVVTNTGQHQAYEPMYIDKEALYHHKAVEMPENAEGGRWLVGCGKPALQEVRIVNPDTLKTCPDRDVGEIWVKGKSVCRGYWGRPDATKEAFQAYTSDSNEGPFLRTGDLGFLKNGELYVTGRHKEVVIIDGRNLYPQDIEDIVQPGRVALRKGCGAAFSVDIEDKECLVLVQEVARGASKGEVNFETLAGDMRKDILDAFGVGLHTLVFIETGTFLKTSSGKIRRRSMREKFLKNKLKEVARSTQSATAKSATVIAAETSLDRVGKMQAGLVERKKSVVRKEIETLLLSLLEAHMGVPAKDIDITRPFSDFGLDSKSLVGLSGELSEALGRTLAPRILYDNPNIEALAQNLAGEDAKVEGDTIAHPVLLDEPIAIVGMGCRLPGNVSTPEQFWELLNSDKDAIEVVPSSRWDVDAFYDEDPAVPGKASTKWGGFISDVAAFDAGFFNISPREASCMDPQQRLLMESTWEALENARILPSSLSGSKTGIFVGISNSDYERLRTGSENPNEPHTGTGNALCISANRLSYFLNTHGPSHAVDTACSSSLVAVHQACLSLRTGESNLALVGGVNLILTPDMNITFSKARMMAADGKCKTFDDSADGYVRGEGCGMFVLKRLSEAELDGNPILAILRGTGVSQDGRSNGLTAPHGPSQEVAIKNALNQAGLTPGDVQYVEAHGTGTPLGDPVEIGALNNVYGAERTKDNPLLIGSVKTNIGHLEAAAGVAGLMKVVLSLQHKKIPAHRNLTKLNTYIPWKDTYIDIPVTTIEWPDSAGQALRAGVSSFGFGGTNTHVVVERYDGASIQPISLVNSARIDTTEETNSILALSAKSKEALIALAQSHWDILDNEGVEDIAQYCYQNNTSREAFPYRTAFIADSKSSLQSNLVRFDYKSTEGVFASSGEGVVNTKTAFLFTGQGSQYTGMGEHFYNSYPHFKAVLDQCAEILKRISDIDVLEILFKDSRARINQTEFTQPALFSYEYALAQLWISWGVVPETVIGHSVGEFVAACVAGVFSLEDALMLISTRGRLMGELQEKGQMMAVFSHKEDVKEVLSQYADRVSVGAVNGPGQVVLSGGEVELDEISELLKAHKIETRKLQVSHGFHSPLMEPILTAFLDVANKVTYKKPTIDIISNVSGAIANDSVSNADYWCQHIMAPVLFEEGVRTLSNQGINVFLEIGPQATLVGMGRRCLSGLQYHWICSSQKDGQEIRKLSKAIAEYFANGGDVDWREINKTSNDLTFKLPTYPFQNSRYWYKQRKECRSNAINISYADDNRQYHPLLGQRLNYPRLAKGEMHFEAFMNLDTPQLVKAFFNEGVASLGVSLYLEMMLESGAEAFHTSALNVMDLEIISDLVLREGDNINIQTFVEPLATNELRVKCYALEKGEDGGDIWNLVSSAAVAKSELNRRPKANMLKGFRERLIHKIDAKEYFENCSDRGLNYCAGSQQVITQLYGDENEVLGEVRMPDTGKANIAGVRLSHDFIEGCFQVLGALCYGEGDTTFVPYRIARIDVYEEPGQIGWAYFSKLSTWEDEGRHIDINMMWLNEAGEPVVKISCMRLKARNVPQQGLIERLANLTREHRLREITEFLSRLVSKGLSIDASELDKNRSLLELGMDSLVAMEVLGRVRYSLDLDINVVALQQGVSVNTLAQILVERLYGNNGSDGSNLPEVDYSINALVCIQQGAAGRIPLILVHPVGGSVFCYADLARAIGEEQPVYALQAHAFIDEECALESVDEMATEYIREIVAIQPHGPYLLGGWSLGGFICFEIANRLKAAGEDVEMLALMDSSPMIGDQTQSEQDKNVLLTKLIALDIGLELELTSFLRGGSHDDLLQLVFEQAKERGLLPELMVIDALERRHKIMKIIWDATLSHELPHYDGSVSLFKAEVPLEEYNSLTSAYGWESYAKNVEHIQTVPGNHVSLLHGDNVGILASYLRKEINSKIKINRRFFEKTFGDSTLSDINTVIHQLKNGKANDEFMAQLIVNEEHPFFFDHPLDHVPGTLLIEGVLQLVNRVLVTEDPDNSSLKPYVKTINISFRRWVEKAAPVDVSVRLKSGGANYLNFIGVVSQDDNIACDVDLTVEYQIVPEVITPAIEGSELAEDKLLHKHNTDNVLLQPIDKILGNIYQANLRKPLESHIFSDGSETAMPALYLLEASRQITTHLSHSLYDVPLGMSMNLISMSMTLDRPSARNDQTCLSYDATQVELKDVDDQVKLIGVTIQDSHGEYGVVEITAQAVNKETYQKQRGTK